MSDERMAKGLIIGFLSGAVVGGVIALLYAPKSGKELRQDLKRKGEEIAEDVEEYLKDAQAKAKHLINEGKEKSAHLITEAREKAEGLLKDAEQIMSDAKKKVADEGSRLKTAVKAGIDTYKDERGAGAES
ncbi:MAG: YtxH domain-containing protein [Ignavibacteriae bacterium]|nr:YtxH domain-containing protein [Ignavibacteriota bacterium]